jgi:hypothetical protein
MAPERVPYGFGKAFPKRGMDIVHVDRIPEITVIVIFFGPPDR